ncbi:hypothetical protein KXV68_000508, partial [Aspergillus fumigatus]
SSQFDAVEIHGTSQIRIVKQIKIERSKAQVEALRTTSHENLVNLQEVFLEDNMIFLIYEEWGIPLENIYSVFHLGEVEIATICKGVLHGLAYIHDVLDLYHGAINVRNILISADGGVKIASIGN